MALLAYLTFFILIINTALATIYFKEDFSDLGIYKLIWIHSTANGVKQGDFKLSESFYKNFNNADVGIQTTENNRYYGVSAKFRSFSNKDKSLVIQYTVRHPQKFSCASGYIKLFPMSTNSGLMNSETRFYVVFGPDFCEKNKVRFGVNYKSEHLEYKRPISAIMDKNTHLYTLIIRPDNTYVIKIDNRRVRSGNLADDFDFDHFTEKRAAFNKFSESDEYYDDPDVIVRKKPKKVKPQKKFEETTADEQLLVFNDIGTVGFELYQGRAGTIFDNILITDDEKYAQQYGEETWGVLKELEDRVPPPEIEEPKSSKKPLNDFDTNNDY